MMADLIPDEAVEAAARAMVETTRALANPVSGKTYDSIDEEAESFARSMSSDHR